MMGERTTEQAALFYEFSLERHVPADLRGPNGAKDEFLLAATAQNLRKLAKLIPMPAPAIA